MKKISTITFLLVMMLTGITVFTSCSDSDDDLPGGLSSWYASVEPNNNAHNDVYNFINKNTVVKYHPVVTVDWIYWNGPSEEVPSHSGWYYQSGCDEYLTYVVEDNKIILTNGSILTILNNGNELREGSTKLTRW